MLNRKIEWMKKKKKEDQKHLSTSGGLAHTSRGGKNYEYVLNVVICR
jgi:hypothetical protein